MRGLAHTANDRPVIHALHNRPSQDNPDSRYDSRSSNKPAYNRKRPTQDDTKTCKACLNVGHCITSGDLCYPLAKATLCQYFLSNSENDELTKRNIRQYRQDRKERKYKNKKTTRMRGMIRKMYANGATEDTMTPIIHLTHAMEDSSDDEYYSGNDSMSPTE